MTLSKNESNKLDSSELPYVEEAFNLIDIAVDKYTNSPKLHKIWRDLHDLLEENGIEK